MSAAQDYDQAEILFCGTWKIVANENVEALMATADMTEAMKKAIMKDDRVVTIVRDGDTFHYKTHIGDVDVDFKEKIGEQSEWEDKEKKPIVHVKTMPTFKDGALVQDCTPIEPGEGKRYIVTLTRHEEELYWDLSLPDETSVTARHIWKKC